MRTTTIWTAAAAIAVLALAGCENETRDEGPCDAVVPYADADWCIVIEEGFLAADCPEDYPEGREFDDVVVCGEEEAPDEMRAELEARGYLPMDCEDDPELGIVYVSHDTECVLEDVVCPEGDEAFKNECGCGCRYVGECEDGDTRMDDCNECWCTDGRWECTLIGCPECEEGETRTDIDACEVCECDGGFWSCSDLVDCVPECEDGELRDFPETCESCRCDGGGWSCVPDDECLAEACADECAEPADSGDWVCTAEGFQPSACVAECYELDVQDWASCAVCEEGDTEVDGCTTSTCFQGRWWESEDEWCVQEECLAACPTTCEAPEDQPCGDNLTYHCTACHMTCYGVAEENPELCDDPASFCASTPPPDAVPVEWSAWTPGDDCRVPEEGLWESAIFTSDADLATAYECTEASGIDWEAERVVRVVFSERPDGEVVGVWDRGGELYLQLAAPAYCGGPAPTNAVLHVRIPATGPTEIRQDDCTWGYCIGPPAP